MVVQVDAEADADRKKSPRVRDVARARRGASARMIVSEDDGARSQLDRASDDLAHVERCCVDGAGEHDLVALKSIGSVQ